MEEEFKTANMKKFYEEKEFVESYYYKNNSASSILIASDIHYHPNVDKELFKLLVAHTREIKPDFVVMPGDQIETINFIDNSKEKTFFESIIRNMSEICPVIIIPGNHEIGNFDVNKYVNRDYSGNTRAMKYFDSLNKYKNVYFLNNEKTTINGMTFLGFNPRLSTYLKKGDEATNEAFIEDYLKSGLRMAELDYNILLTHSPILLNEPMVLGSIDEFSKLTDLAITGHLHDGYLPKKFDRLLGDTGAGLFFTPLVAPIPGMMCRGVHDFGRGYILVSQGFRKWTADIGLFNAFERITANDVERLIISNPEMIFSSNKPIESSKLK